MHTINATDMQVDAVLCKQLVIYMLIVITSITHIAVHDENKYAEYAVSLL